MDARRNAPSIAKSMQRAMHVRNVRTYATNATLPRPEKTPLVPDAPTPVDNDISRMSHEAVAS